MSRSWLWWICGSLTCHELVVVVVDLRFVVPVCFRGCGGFAFCCACMSWSLVVAFAVVSAVVGLATFAAVVTP